MKSRLAIILVALVASFFGIIPVKAEETNNVKGASIVWDSSTKASSIPNLFVVKEDETLTIEAGTKLEATSPSILEIDGLINFSIGAPIILKNWTIVVDSEATEKSIITNCLLDGSIIVKNGIVEIKNNQIKSPDVGILVKSARNTVILNNQIYGFNGGVKIDESTFNLVGNEINGAQVGLEINNSAGEIYYNTVSDNRIGVKIAGGETQSIQLKRNNIFANNLAAIQPDNYNVDLEISGAVTIENSENWWGCETGPKVIEDETACALISGIAETNFVVGKIIHQMPAKGLIINEILANPVIETTQEWFEIYNPQDYGITVFDLLVGDNYYKEAKATSIDKLKIDARGFVVVAADKEVFLGLYSDFAAAKVVGLSGKIGNGLSNTADKITLSWKDGTGNFDIIDEVAYGGEDGCSGAAKENYSCARFDEGYKWSEMTTPGTENKKAEIKNDPVIETTAIQAPVNEVNVTTAAVSCPTGILKIAEAKKLFNCRVMIQGTVRKPSGNYFFVYDETGEIKIYLQAAKKIKKPRLMAGYRVKISGVVDNYRTGLRLLPENSADIELISQTVVRENVKEQPAKEKMTASLVAEEAGVTVSPTLEEVSNELGELAKLTKVQAMVKGAEAITQPISNHYALKSLLIFAMILLVALLSFNFGLKMGRQGIKEISEDNYQE